MFESIISEAQKKFQTDGKARDVLNVLLGIMSNPASGGFHGFVERFSRTGSGDAVISWIRNSENRLISNERLEAVLGANTLNSIAAQAKLDRTTATTVAAFMIPRVVDALTPNGDLPDEANVLKTIKQFSSSSDGFDKNESAGKSKFFLLLLLLALLFGIVGYFFVKAERAPASISTVNQTTAEDTPTTAKTGEANFQKNQP